MEIDTKFFIRQNDTFKGVAAGEVYRETDTKVVVSINDIYILKEDGVFSLHNPNADLDVHVSKKTGNVTLTKLNSYIEDLICEEATDSGEISSSICGSETLEDALVFVYLNNLTEDDFFTEKKIKEILKAVTLLEEAATATGDDDYIWKFNIPQLRAMVSAFPNIQSTEKEKFDNDVVFAVALAESCRRITQGNTVLIRSIILADSTDYKMDIKNLLTVEHFRSSGFSRIAVNKNVKLKLSTFNVVIEVTDRWKGKEYIISLNIYNENRYFEPNFTKGICSVREFGISFYAISEIHPTMLPYVQAAIDKAKEVHSEKFKDACIMWR